MTVTIDGGGHRRGGMAGGLVAWLWPQPKAQRDTRAGWFASSSLMAWLWPSAIHDEPYGHRHGLMATLFGWAWPGALDRGVKRWWHVSWLWSWAWPGKVLGPDGEICPLAPWHPALRPEVCPGETWRHKLRRHGPVMFMMFGATAIAAPTFMEGNLPGDGGRLSLFRSDGPTTDAPPTGDGPTVEPGEGPGGGDGELTTLDTGDLGGGDGDGPTAPNDSSPPDAGFDGDFGGSDPDLGGVGGDAPGGETPGGQPPGGGETAPPTGDGDTTIPDPDGELDPGLPIGGGGSGGGGGIGGGGGGGGTGPTEPGDDPFNPTDPVPPNVDPPGPLPPPGPPQPPTVPNPPGGGPGGGPITVPQDLIPPGGDDDDEGGPGGPGGGPGDTGPVDGDVPSAAPEPATWAMMILGFGAVGYAIRRRRFAATVN